MPTVRQIAEQAGVSISTVSLALNKKKGVSESTRQHVMAIASQLRRQELAESQNGAQGKSYDRPATILILHPAKVDDEVFTQFLRGIWAAAATPDLHIQMMMNEPDLLETNIYQLLFSDPDLLPDGVLVLGAKRYEVLVERFSGLGIPCVLAQRESQCPATSAVGVDEVAMAFEATEHLLNLGHRNIAFAGGKPDYTYTDGRVAGYRQALEARGITPPDRWLGLAWSREATESILDSSPEVTAIVFLDDGYALQFGLPAVQAYGYRIPDDISVLSFDNIKETIEHSPPITSVELPFYEIGYRAVKVLEEHIHDPLLQSQQIRLRTHLHKRASCGPPRTTRHSDREE